MSVFLLFLFGFNCLWAEGYFRYQSRVWLGSGYLLFSAPRCIGVIALVSECDEPFASTPSASNIDCLGGKRSHLFKVRSRSC